MPTVANLAVSVTANTGKFTKGMDRSRRGLKGFSRDAKKATLVTRALSKALIAAGGALGAFAIARGITRAAKSVDNFNQAMRSSLAIMGDVSLAMRRQMERAALSVAKTTKFSGEEAAKAYFFLASAGLSAQQSIAAMPLVAQFAQAGMFDLARATDLLTDAQSALGLTTKDAQTNLKNMTRVADVLVKANTLANASVEQFSEALTTKAGAALKIYNKSMEEGVAVLAAFADQGKKGSDAGTAFDIVLRDLTTRAILARSEMKKYGISVFDSFGKLRHLADIIGDVEKALAGQSAETKKTTLLTIGFQQKSVSNLQTLLGTSEAIRKYYNELERAGGITQDVSEKQLTPLNAAVQHLKGSFLDLAVGMTPAIDKFAELVERSAKATDNMLRLIPVLRVVLADQARLISQVGKMGLRLLPQLATGLKPPAPTPSGPLGPVGLGAGMMGPPERPPNFAGLLNRMMAPMRMLRIFGSAMWDEWNEKLDEFNKKVSSVAGIVQGLLQRAKTPAERFREQLEALNMTLAVGKINADEYRKALRQARMEMEQRLARLAPKIPALPDVARRAEFQQVSLARMAVQGVRTPSRPQLVRDPQLAMTNDLLNRIRFALNQPLGLTQ